MTSPAPRFSIVTPSLNQGAYLEECLTSVRTQTGNFLVEHLVMDGGSTDSTLEILKNKHSGPWVSEQDRGQTDAINKGLARARGEILSYLCADDYLEPQALEIVHAAFEADASCDVVFGDAWFLEGDSGWKRRKSASGFTYERLRRGNFLLQPAVFFRRRVYEKFGPLNPELRFCMDHEYWLRIGAATRWHGVHHPLATCRLHDAAKTSCQLADAWEEARRMQRTYGLIIRPTLEALWMRTLGHHYYRIKRRIFQSLGKRKSP